MSLVSNTGTLTVSDGLPTWVPAVGTWAQITGTTLSTVDPSPTPSGATGPQSKISAWNGFAVNPATSDVWLVAAGGHADYAGNEVNKLNLASNSPAWTQVLAPTSNANLVDAASYYADGKPTSRHHFYGVQFSAAASRVMLFGGSMWAAGGGFHNAISGFHVGTQTYDSSATHGNMGGAYGSDVFASCVDTNTGHIYIFQDFGVGRWHSGTFAWSEVLAPGGGNPAGQNGPTAFDSTRNRIFLVGGQYTHRHLYDIAGNSFSQPTLTGAAASAVENCSAGSSMVYVPALDVYLLRPTGSGGTVYQITASGSTFTCTTFATSGGASIPESANNDGSNANGPYAKFIYVPNCKGVWYTPRHNANGWFLRVH